LRLLKRSNKERSMKRLFWVASVCGLFGVGPAVAKEKGTGVASGASAAAKDPKSGNIKDDEAMRCIQTRLEEQSGLKGWKIELKDVAGSSRDFTATNGGRSEKGTVNVAKSYPNQGSLRVYLVPKD
jgi:hypothetical protein